MSQVAGEQHLPDNFTHEYIITPNISITIRFVPSALKYITAVAKNEMGGRREGNKHLFEIIFAHICSDIKALNSSSRFLRRI